MKKSSVFFSTLVFSFLIACASVDKPRGTTTVLSEVKIENREDLRYLRLSGERVVSLFVGSKSAHCVGVIISADIMMTNRHCILTERDCETVSSSDAGCLSILAAPAEMDLVFVRVKTKHEVSASYERVSIDELRGGESIVRWQHEPRRHSSLFELRRTSCLFLPERRDLKYHTFDQINKFYTVSIGSVIPHEQCERPGRLGDSGSPMLTDGGLLVGMVFGSSIGAGNVYFLEGYFIADALYDAETRLNALANRG